jgi:Tfp pilus assembly protein PilO
MLRLITPIILIGISIAGFFVVIQPYYQDIKEMQAKSVAYNEALNNSKVLEVERDKLVEKYNLMNPVMVDRLNKFLPDSVDNIRLILEIERIAAPYGMVLRDVKYDTLKKADETNPNTVKGAVSLEPNKDYNVWDLEFSTQGSYSNFLNFVRDLQNNLRIVDISAVEFSSDAGVGANIGQAGSVYKYGFKVKTYWLKN